jgi:hypothetical protein
MQYALPMTTPGETPIPLRMEKSYQSAAEGTTRRLGSPFRQMRNTVLRIDMPSATSDAASGLLK